jgi:hypothetical protein
MAAPRMPAPPDISIAPNAATTERQRHRRKAQLLMFAVPA